MTDYTKLVREARERLNRRVALGDPGVDHSVSVLCDAVEAQAAEIAQYKNDCEGLMGADLKSSATIEMQAREIERLKAALIEMATEGCCADPPEECDVTETCRDFQPDISKRCYPCRCSAALEKEYPMIPEKCPLCAAPAYVESPDHYICGTTVNCDGLNPLMNHHGSCQSRQITALKARTEKAEAERDEARGEVRKAIGLIGVPKPFSDAAAWLAVLPEWVEDGI